MHNKNRKPGGEISLSIQILRDSPSGSRIYYLAYFAATFRPKKQFRLRRHCNTQGAPP